MKYFYSTAGMTDASIICFLPVFFESSNAHIFLSKNYVCTTFMKKRPTSITVMQQNSPVKQHGLSQEVFQLTSRNFRRTVGDQQSNKSNFVDLLGAAIHNVSIFYFKSTSVSCRCQTADAFELLNLRHKILSQA